MDQNAMQKLKETKDFISVFCNKLSSAEETDSAKQVYFLDNKFKVEESLSFLKGIKDTLNLLGDEIPSQSDEEKALELSSILINKLTKTIEIFKNSLSQINQNITVEETIKPVTEETIKEAMENNKSTQQIAKDMNEIQQKANISQLQEFTHAILIGGKFLYYKIADKNELNTVINEVVNANQGNQQQVPQVFELELKPVALKRKAMYVVQ